MYSVIHRLPEKTPLQFAFYDIAGEAFSRLDENIQQQQFQYCEGVIFVIDPTAPIRLTEDALVGFLNTFKALKGKASTKLSTLPVAVIISKADLFKKR
jgi:signal recognition particle receptor subunit beta